MVGLMCKTGRLWLACIMFFPLLTSVGWAEQKLSLAYNLLPHQVLTYQEVSSSEIMAPGNSYTIRLTKQFALIYYHITGDRALVGMRTLLIKPEKIVAGVTSTFSDSFLPAVGNEIRFFTDKRGVVEYRDPSDESMILEGFPLSPVGVGEHWRTVENAGGMNSDYVVRKVYREKNLTYYLIQGRHQARNTEERTDSSGIHVHTVTEVTGDSWIYYVADWGQILSRQFTGSAVRCDTVDRPEGPVIKVTNIKIRKDLQLLKIVH